MINLSGKRLVTNKCKVQVCGSKQFVITIPRGIALKLELKKGSILCFEYWRDGQFRVFKEEQEKEE